ncbi:MAG: hypothetical protein IPJ65_12230 [Archangiaceae bacterium]|nr:hypothetical protein [Archangiaceae bacterium]
MLRALKGWLALLLCGGCIDFAAVERDVCAQRPDLCGDGGTAGGASAGGSGGSAGGTAGGGGSGGGATGFVQLDWSAASAFGFAFTGDAGVRQTLMLTNSGTRTSAPITLELERGDAGFAVRSHNCTTLSAGRSCTATVELAPSVEGPLTDTLFAREPESPASVALSGTGRDPYHHVTLTLVFAGGTGVVHEGLGNAVNVVCDAGVCTFDRARASYLSFRAEPAGDSIASWDRCRDALSCAVNGPPTNVAFTATFRQPNLAFVTSRAVAPATLGVSQRAELTADAICNAHAADAGLEGTYQAVLSHRLDAGANSYVWREHIDAGGWVRLDGRRVMEDRLGSLRYLPLLDEHGTRLPDDELVLTGGAFTGSGRDCASWSSSALTYTAGDPSNENAWTREVNVVTGENATYRPCTQAGHLYCFGSSRLGAMQPLTGRPPGTRLAFSLVTRDLYRGLAALDAECTAAADGGSFKAALARPGLSALSRFDAGGPPWVRADGLVLWSRDAGLLSAP